MTDLSTHVFALDLTSVCVSTGIVQLPMKMQPFFEDGEIDATVDGEDVRLEFAGPRRLGGFKAHFEKRGLNANDKIRFELKCEDAKATEVLAACVKRERSKPSEQPPLGVEGDAERRSSSPEVAGSDSEAATGGARVDGSWSETGSTVRAVRKVTIVGSDMLPALGSTQTTRVGPGNPMQDSVVPTTPGGARPTTWQALDGLSREDADESAAAVEFADTTVRAVRRGANRHSPTNTGGAVSATTLAMAHQPADENVQESQAAAPFDDAVEHSATMRLSDLVAPAEGQQGITQRGRPAPARARIFAGRGPRADQSAFGREAKPVSPRPEPATSESAEPEPLAERELVPVVRTSAAALSRSSGASLLASTGDSAPTMDSFVRSAAIAGGAFDSGETAVDQPSQVAEQQRNSSPFQRSPTVVEASPAAVSKATPSPVGASTLVIDDADFGGVDAAPQRKVVPDNGVGHEMKGAPENDGLEPPVSPAITASDVVSHNGLGQDLSLVTRFLDRPDVPAIVRSDLVAERLGMTAERCERALERLSEDRDRVSRIRKGAYMIRRDATKRVAE